MHGRRDEVIARLSQAFGDGALDVDELERRLARAHAATTVAELDALVADLPSAALVAPEPRRRRVRVWFRRATLAVDEAALSPGVTTYDVHVAFGSLAIVLPPGLPIEVQVSSVAGSIAERHRVPRVLVAERPTLRIVGAVRFGSLDISSARREL